jgi:hypothetical protein
VGGVAPPPCSGPWRPPRSLLWLAVASSLHGLAFVVLARRRPIDLNEVPPLFPQTIDLSPTETTAATSASAILFGVKETKHSGLPKATREKVRPPPLPAGVDTPDTATFSNGSEAWSAPVLRPPDPERSGVTRFGLGVGALAGRINPNLSLADLGKFVNAAEIENIVRTEEAGRLAAHRQHWSVAGVERWRAAIEGYVPRIRLGNQVALGASHAAFTAFLRSMARRMRPWFVDGFLDWIRSLPPNHVLRQSPLQTRVEIVLDGASGSIARMGVVLTSGVTAFDVGALDAVQRSAPFGVAPAEILSPDGRVYVQWDLRSDHSSELNDDDARPSILR